MSEKVKRVARAIEPLIRRAGPIHDWDEVEIARVAVAAMQEPDYLAQTGDVSVEDAQACREWFDERARDGRKFGLKHGRMSIDREHGLLLVEGWLVRPDDEGEPRFQFAATG